MRYFIDNEWAYDGGVIPAGVFEPTTDAETAVVANLITSGFALLVDDSPKNREA